MKSLLIILATCTSPTDCVPTSAQGTLFEYPRLVDCVRAKATVDAALEVACTGKPFDPRQLTLG